MNETVEEFLHRHAFTLAPLSRRAVAFVIDELLLSSLFLALIWQSVSLAKDFESFLFITNAYTLEYLGIKIIYQTLFVALYGASLGKIAMKIKVVSLLDAEMPGWGAALNRAIFRILSEIIFYLGFIWAMFDPNNQAWHDRSAKTVVVVA